MRIFLVLLLFATNAFAAKNWFQKGDKRRSGRPGIKSKKNMQEILPIWF